MILCVYYTPLYVATFNSVFKTIHGKDKREYTLFLANADAMAAYQTICKLRDDIKKYPLKYIPK